MGCTTSRDVNTAASQSAPAEARAIVVLDKGIENIPLEPEQQQQQKQKHAEEIVIEPEATCGFMLKEGSNWLGVKKRFFQLQMGRLSWFEGEGPEGLGDRELGHVLLCGYKVVADADSDTRIKLESGGGGRTLVIETASVDERAEWTNTIQQHIDYTSRI